MRGVSTGPGLVDGGAADSVSGGRTEGEAIKPGVSRTAGQSRAGARES